MKILTIMILGFLVISCNKENSAAEQKKWLTNFTQKNYIGVVGKPFTFESFALKDSTNKTIDFKQLQGKVILLNFFATWCPPCVGELPEFEKYMQKFDNTKFQVIAVNARESAERVNRFMQKHKYHFPAIIDQEGRYFMRYGVRSLPASMIIDKKGKVRFLIQGVRNWASADFTKFFKILMDE